MQSNAMLITGGGGFLGVGLAKLLLARDPEAQIVVTDIVQHPRLAALRDRVRFVQADLADATACAACVTPDIGTVYHFASLVSVGAERDFEAGLKANVLATLNLLEACRRQGQRPRFVFTSSIATFGGSRLPATVDDWTWQHPQNSYGMAKVVGEQWLNDYSRKGFVDGRGVRLPAIVVRDEPNTAASGYVSALFREPLHGRDYVCPVGPATRIPILSARRCVETLAGLGALPAGALEGYRTINGPNLAPEPSIQQMIDSWPRQMKTDRAVADASLADVLADYSRELSAEATR